MKTFKQLIAEVAEPKSDDELNFKQKHAIEVIDHPVSLETQHSAKKVSKPRRADYTDEEDDVVYEASKLDPVGKEDGDIDNDGDKDKSDEYLHARRKAISRAMKEAAEKKLDPVGKADADIDNDGDTDSSDEYLHARRKAIAKAMKKEATQSPYAIGMASAMKQTGDKPPLKKSTITKAHKIAKSIEKNESLQEANEKKIIAGLNAGDSIDVIVQNNLNKKGDNKDEILKVIRDYNWKKRMKKEEVGLDEAVAGPQDCWPGYRKVGTKMGTGRNAGKRVNDCEKIGEALDAHIVRGDGYAGVPDGVVAKAKDTVKKMKPATASDHTRAMYKALGDLGWEKTAEGKWIRESTNNGVNENLGKASKKMKFWHNTDPRDVKNRLKTADPAFVDKLAKQPEGKLSGPAELQRRLAVKMKKEETDLTENFKVGAVKLADGSSVIIKEQDAKLLNQLVNELSDKNKDAMMKTAMKDKKGFNEILSFAKEAL